MYLHATQIFNSLAIKKFRLTLKAAVELIDESGLCSGFSMTFSLLFSIDFHDLLAQTFIIS